MSNLERGFLWFINPANVAHAKAEKRFTLIIFNDATRLKIFCRNPSSVCSLQREVAAKSCGHTVIIFIRPNWIVMNVAVQRNGTSAPCNTNERERKVAGRKLASPKIPSGGLKSTSPWRGVLSLSLLLILSSITLIPATPFLCRPLSAYTRRVQFINCPQIQSAVVSD